MTKKELLQIVQSQEAICNVISDWLWKNPEVGGEEKESSAYLKKILADAGFRIVNAEKMPYAFYADYGHGKPVVGILGEFDALPKLSQKVIDRREPVNPDKPGEAGHGCGHNLIGSSGVAAALAIKSLIDSGVDGTIRFYGCPEEELLCGKVKMAYYHMFDDCDIALSWHPNFLNKVHEEAYLANASIRFYFTGVTSHAAAAPERGRSALDAVELMAVGTNYLREHVLDKARIHYTTDSGGLPPNIIPDKASSWYYVRAPHMSDVKNIMERLFKIAEGAALMTETTVRSEVESGCCELLCPKTFADITYENLVEAGEIPHTEEERNFARKIVATQNAAAVARFQNMVNIKDVLHSGPAQRYVDFKPAASSDVGDVSKIIPTNMFTTATWPIACMAHTWQATASSGTSIGAKGALHAAKVMAGTAYDLFTKPDVLAKIQEEFEEMKDPAYAPMYEET